VYNYIGLGLNFEIRGNGIRWNETKHVELEQFLHSFTSRGFDSVSWAFLLLLARYVPKTSMTLLTLV